MIETLCGILAVVLLLTVAAGLVRVMRGPTPADRMLAAQLLGTTGIGILLLLSQATGIAGLRDIAMTLALLTVLATIAFVKRGWPVREAHE